MKRLLLLCLVLSAIVLSKAQTSQDSIRQELRGVWISTVKMLDYPSRRGLSAEQLKREYVEILDSLQKIHINAIFFQVRPAADAFYNSPYEPWSEWLTGKQGQPPSPYFDPLKFYIEQAHRRGMQFHAWINPFRAIATIQYADVVPNHISKTKPQWFFDYGLHRYFNPGIPEVRDYIVKIITDIARRYDIDGIHFDDYFYPYPERDGRGRIIPIPDYKTYKKYGQGFKNIKDWRRHNITTFIRQVHDSIKAIDSNLIFGISPNAVWRNKRYDPRGSDTRGLAAYDWLYADILLWDSLKLVDYIAPQLYFYIGHPAADYKTLLYWWTSNVHNVNLFVGLNIQGIDPTGRKKHWGNPSEIPNQIRMARRLGKTQGFILYRSKSLLSNPLGIYDTLKNDLFADSAVVPPFKTIPRRPPLLVPAQTPADTVRPLSPAGLDYFFIGETLTVLWQQPEDTITDKKTDISYYTVQISLLDKTGEKQLGTFRVSQPQIKLPARKGWLLSRKNKYVFRVKAVNATGLESQYSQPLIIKAKEINYRALRPPVIQRALKQ